MCFLKRNGIAAVKMNDILWTMFWGSVFWIFWIVWFFPRKYKYRCIRIYVWFKDDKHVIWMWIWFILKNVSLLDRIWSMWLVCFAHSPLNFIFWLSRLIASLTRHQTSYSGSAGWYFRYQSIHIQITYTYHNNPSISAPLFSLWLILMVIVLAIFWKR